MKLKVKKGDTVNVISGSESGKSGKVLQVYTKTMRVLIEGINIRKRHTRPTQASPQGGVVSKERPIHYSNIAIAEAAAKTTKAKKTEKKTARASK